MAVLDLKAEIVADGEVHLGRDAVPAMCGLDKRSFADDLKARTPFERFEEAGCARRGRAHCKRRRGCVLLHVRAAR